MPKYYFLMSSLPALDAQAAGPPISYADFLGRAEQSLAAKDFALVAGAPLELPADGVFPKAAASSALLSRYYRWELSLRNELARLRAQKAQKPFDKYLKPGQIEHDGLKAAQAAFQADDPLQGELVIERERRAFIEALAVNKYFDRENVLAYSLLVQALERKARFDADRGKSGYGTVYRSVLDTAEYRDESGDDK